MYGNNRHIGEWMCNVLFYDAFMGAGFQSTPQTALLPER